jgi:hypothetical protein
VLLVRGVSLSDGEKLILGASRPANLAWRRSGAGVLVEAEAPYKDKLGSTTIKVGGLGPGASYPLQIDGKSSKTVAADRAGVATLNVDLSVRRTVRLGATRGR